jgi:tetratricopeptide (TPR) repeat protein
MQNQTKTQIVLFLLELLLCFSGMAQKSEEKEIITFLKNHEKAFQKQDAKQLKADWLHDNTVDYVTIMNFFYDKLSGWQKVDSLITDLSSRKRIEKIIGGEKYRVIRQDHNLAVAEYDQIRYDSNLNLTISVHRSFVLVKKQNAWKIASLINTIPATYEYNGINAENSVNGAGYEFMGIKDYPKAIEILKLNVKYFPESWNTYDSLGEAYMKNGDTQLAIENYEKSVELNPKSVAGIEALKKLKQQK